MCGGGHSFGLVVIKGVEEFALGSYCSRVYTADLVRGAF